MAGLSWCMCLVLLGLNSHPKYQLIVAANRDEFYDRPTAPAEFWPDAPALLAGRDLQAGGTWLGVDRRGRFAAVTNYRQGEREPPAPRSRGLLVSEYLTGNRGTSEYMERVQGEADRYNGFNLLAGDHSALLYFSNREGRIRQLTPGIYGLSNHLLDTPWPKVATTKSAFSALLNEGGSELSAELFSLLSDPEHAPDGLLPSTGISQDWERLLSAAFIVSDRYGTRSSTVVMMGRDGSIRFSERTFGRMAEPGPEVRFEFG
jgi:uncharacterized protein with NRDE domain